MCVKKRLRAGVSRIQKRRGIMSDLDSETTPRALLFLLESRGLRKKIHVYIFFDHFKYKNVRNTDWKCIFFSQKKKKDTYGKTLWETIGLFFQNLNRTIRGFKMCANPFLRDLCCIGTKTGLRRM